MQQRSDYAVLALIVASTMITTALGAGAQVAGFSLPPLATFALLVVGAPIPVVLGILPQLGIRVPSVVAPVAAEEHQA